MVNSSDVLVRLNHINKIFGKTIQQQVLFDINLEIESGLFIALIGTSGSGKSTLLNILGTLDTPTSGEYLLAGQSMSSLSENQRADFRNRSMGFIFQFHHLFPQFTAYENVLLPYQISHFGNLGEEIKERARTLLARVGLGNKINAQINNLSGGQQQRVAIARALINRPIIVLADEPTGNLDSTTSNNILDLMQEINQEEGTTFIVVTHDFSIARRSDRVIELADGRIDSDSCPINETSKNKV